MNVPPIHSPRRPWIKKYCNTESDIYLSNHIGEITDEFINIVNKLDLCKYDYELICSKISNIDDLLENWIKAMAEIHNMYKHTFTSDAIKKYNIICFTPKLLSAFLNHDHEFVYNHVDKYPQIDLFMATYFNVNLFI